jgi:hypothetical protein
VTCPLRDRPPPLIGGYAATAINEGAGSGLEPATFRWTSMCTTTSGAIVFHNHGKGGGGVPPEYLLFFGSLLTTAMVNWAKWFQPATKVGNPLLSRIWKGSTHMDSAYL